MKHSFAIIEAGVLTEAHGIDQPVPWWSFTKTILASAALVLVRDGRLTLDCPVRDRPFTLRQLLQHQSGLVDYGEVDAKRSEEHTSELQSHLNLVCRLLLEKKKNE